MRWVRGVHSFVESQQFQYVFLVCSVLQNIEYAQGEPQIEASLKIGGELLITATAF